MDPLRLDAEGRLVRSPAIEKLIRAAKSIVDHPGNFADRNYRMVLLQALGEVALETDKLERGEPV